MQGQSAEKVTINYDYHGVNGVLGQLVPRGAEIDVYGNIVLQEDKKLSTLYVAGILRGDNFPSTESFIRDTSGQAVFLGIGFYDAQGGNKETGPFFALIGDAKRNITSFGLIIELDSKGNFVSVIGGHLENATPLKIGMKNS